MQSHPYGIHLRHRHSIVESRCSKGAEPCSWISLRLTVLCLVFVANLLVIHVHFFLFLRMLAVMTDLFRLGGRQVEELQPKKRQLFRTCDKKQRSNRKKKQPNNLASILRKSERKRSGPSLTLVCLMLSSKNATYENRFGVIFHRYGHYLCMRSPNGGCLGQ
jgi:hypothetical protein